MRFVLIVPSKSGRYGEKAILCETKEELIAKTMPFVKDAEDIAELETTGFSITGDVEWVELSDEL